jgi:hypothetical protein
LVVRELVREERRRAYAGSSYAAEAILAGGEAHLCCDPALRLLYFTVLPAAKHRFFTSTTMRYLPFLLQ